ncbi:MAG TPA: TolC family protein [Steroidobacteraceae bacterium]|nr:TolC family protein [Steroidobacteraceae bacterium]
MKSRYLAAIALLGLVARSALALPPLAELEARLALSPESQMYDQAYAAARAQFQAGKGNLGVSVYANAGAADNRDIIDPTHSYAYRETAEGLGLSVPVLGSRLQLQSGLNDQRVQLAQLDEQRALQRLELLRRLRAAYADYWRAQRTQILAERFLANAAAVGRALDLRATAGLLLDSDRLELESGFTLAQRDAALAGDSKADALQTMRALTGDPTLDGGVAAPPLDADCAPASAVDTGWMHSDPELRALRRIVVLRRHDPRRNALYGVQSSIQVGYQSRDQLSTGQHGSSGALTWTFQVPIGYRSQQRHYSEAAAADLARARLDYEIRREELQNQRRALIGREGVLHESLQLASARLAAADAAVEERRLRVKVLTGDAVEQLQRARIARYTAAKAVIKAETALAAWFADWSRFDDSPCATTHPAAAEDSSATAPPRTLYVWQAATWLAEAHAPSGDADAGRLRAAGFGRILVSLDAVQLARALADPAPLAAAVRATQRRGLQVGLLLGDPRWIEAAHRDRLTAVLRALKAVPFNVVHLDLEPQQIDRNATADPQLFAALVATLRAVVAVSHWPVELSVLPRNIGVRVGGRSFAAVLERLQIEPTLMIYVANPQRVVSIAAPIIRRYPQLRFRVALSLERAAPGGQTLSGYSATERQRRLAYVERHLRAANFDGIALQMEDGWALARSSGGG